MAYFRPPVVVNDTDSGLSSVSRTIEFPAEASIASSGAILVACKASIPDLYRKDAQVLLTVDVPENMRRSPGFALFGKYFQMLHWF